QVALLLFPGKLPDSWRPLAIPRPSAIRLKEASFRFILVIDLLAEATYAISVRHRFHLPDDRRILRFLADARERRDAGSLAPDLGSRARALVISPRDSRRQRPLARLFGPLAEGFSRVA